MPLKQRNITELFPYPDNAKKHPEKQIKQIAASIKEFGFNQPIVVDEQGFIIVGHGRYAAARMLGMTEVPTLEVNLTEEQTRAYRLADNKLNESDWDMNIVIEELRSLSMPMLDLTGFDKLILEGEFSFKNKELDLATIDQQAGEHKTKPCPNCGFEF